MLLHMSPISVLLAHHDMVQTGGGGSCVEGGKATNSCLNLWWISPVNPSGPGVLVLGSFLITAHRRKSL